MIVTAFPKITAIQYDGTNSAEILSSWTDQTAGDVVCTGSILSESSGAVTFQFDSEINNVPQVVYAILNLSEGDWLMGIETWRYGVGLEVVTDDFFSARYEVQ